VASRPDILGFVQSWRAELPADWQGVSDQEVDAWRDRSPGGSFQWEP
jgi:hypothetical protein